MKTKEETEIVQLKDRNLDKNLIIFLHFNSKDKKYKHRHIPKDYHLVILEIQ